MKKFLCALIICALVLTALPLGFAAAEETEPAVLFEDDFDSYTDTTNFIEDNAEFRKNWSNDLIEYKLGYKDDEGNDYPQDGDNIGVAKVVADPTQPGNQVLHIQNYDPIGSFFYIAPKIETEGGNNRFDGGSGLKLRDYEVWFNLYSMRIQAAPWVGMSVRKTANVRFNGTNNELLTLKLNGTAEGHHMMSYQPLRGYGGAGSPSAQDIMLDTVKGVYGGINHYGESNSAFAQNNIDNLTEGVVDANKSILNNWVTFRFIVAKDAEKDGSNYACYAYYGDTEFYLGSFYYSSPSVNVEGYLSLNACVADAYIDDFKVTEYTGYSNPVFDPGDPANAGTTVTAKTVADREQAVNTELSINIADMFTIQGDTAAVSYTASAGTISGGIFKYTPTAENARTIIVTAKNNIDNTEVTVTFKVTGTKTSGGEGGCGSSAAGASLGAMLCLCGLAAALKRRAR